MLKTQECASSTSLLHGMVRSGDDTDHMNEMKEGVCKGSLTLNHQQCGDAIDLIVRICLGRYLSIAIIQSQD